MIVTKHQQPSVFAELASSWDELVESSYADTIFLRSDWQRLWWEAYHPGDLFILTVYESETLRGIVPLFKTTNAQGRRSLQFIGTVDVTDYLDLIVEEAYLQPVCEAVASYLAEHHAEFDELDLWNIPATSPTMQGLPRALQSCGFTLSTEQAEVCPVIALPADWETYMENLDKKQRHELRRKLRRAEASVQEGELRWYAITHEHRLEEVMATFYELMRRSQHSKEAFLEVPANKRFFDSLVPWAFERGWLQIFFLEYDSEVIAAYLSFDYNNRIFLYNSGLEPEKYGFLSPGIVLLAFVIQHAIEAGRDVFDFLRGNEEYKYRMGGQDTFIKRLRATLG